MRAGRLSLSTRHGEIFLKKIRALLFRAGLEPTTSQFATGPEASGRKKHSPLLREFEKSWRENTKRFASNIPATAPAKNAGSMCA